MKVLKGAINKGETFCCTVQSCKKFFADTPINVAFAYCGRHYKTFAETSDGYYLKNKIRGYVVASMYMRQREESPTLRFYVMKDSQITTELREQFEQKCLPTVYQFYCQRVNDESLILDTRFILVELLDGAFKIHEGKYR